MIAETSREFADAAAGDVRKRLVNGPAVKGEMEQNELGVGIEERQWSHYFVSQCAFGAVRNLGEKTTTAVTVNDLKSAKLSCVFWSNRFANQNL